MAGNDELLTLDEFVARRKANASKRIWEPAARETAHAHLEEFREGILDLADRPHKLTGYQWSVELNTFREFKLRQNT